MPIFKTIRQTAATGLLSEHRLRILVSEGKCPGMYAGNRFLINTTALAEQLDKESKVNEQKDGERLIFSKIYKVYETYTQQNTIKI